MRCMKQAVASFDVLKFFAFSCAICAFHRASVARIDNFDVDDAVVDFVWVTELETSQESAYITCAALE